MSEHADKLRHMAEVWLQSARDAQRFSLPHQKKQDSDYYRAHAAALLAGAEALERLGAMESTSSTMLPKSASASEGVK